MSKFTYDQLMQWDKDDLAHAILDYQHQVSSMIDLISEFEDGSLTVFEAVQTIKKVI
jgi:hypothetical protein